MKAEKIENKNALMGLNIDCRNRLGAPTPATYFGNCELLGEDGLMVAVEVLSETLETLKDVVLNGAENWSSWLLEGLAIADVKTIGSAGSPKFEVYSTDFGCGKPKKVEIVSINKTGAFCL
ncbi:anthocyanin 5-aromatic acyltransferase [Medicago truncatula]|uniref:Anthocyanin 5-aromatic acyltransferase n=1 Tax=Medicago truncatula TaxID=3880 RepID=A0A072TWT8_MEDTR|nr:anthocyanin 5-aromatic acyltransferase [Medicago truncatula]